VLNFKSRDESFGWCALTTATEHAVKMRRSPWRYSQPKLVQKDAQACQQRHEVVYEKADGACTLSRKKIILSHRKATTEPDGIFRQKSFEDYVT
jgi:hypothetical protein